MTIQSITGRAIVLLLSDQTCDYGHWKGNTMFDISRRALVNLIDKPISQLRLLMPGIRNQHDADRAYGHMTKGELVGIILEEYYESR